MAMQFRFWSLLNCESKYRMPSSGVVSQSLNLCPIGQAQRLGFLISMLIIAPKLTIHVSYNGQTLAC